MNRTELKAALDLSRQEIQAISELLRTRKRLEKAEKWLRQLRANMVPANHEGLYVTIFIEADKQALEKFLEERGGETRMKIYNWSVEMDSETPGDIIVSFHIAGVNNAAKFINAFEIGKSLVEAENPNIFGWAMSLMTFFYGLFKKSR